MHRQGLVASRKKEVHHALPASYNGQAGEVDGEPDWYTRVGYRRSFCWSGNCRSRTGIQEPLAQNTPDGAAGFAFGLEQDGKP
jgi:hypothetical protein